MISIGVFDNSIINLVKIPGVSSSTKKYLKCVNENDKDFYELDEFQENCTETIQLPGYSDGSLVSIYCGKCDRKIDLSKKEVFEKELISIDPVILLNNLREMLIKEDWNVDVLEGNLVLNCNKYSKKIVLFLYELPLMVGSMYLHDFSAIGISFKKRLKFSSQNTPVIYIEDFLSNPDSIYLCTLHQTSMIY
jgi:hypothetical protein